MNYDQVSGALSGASDALSGLGGYIASKGSAKSARANAKIARLNAARSDLNYGAQIREVATNKAITLDSNRVQWAWGGLTMEGTPELVNRSTGAAFDADIGILKQNQKIDRAIYESQARAFESEAKSAEKSGKFSAVQGIISAGASAAALMLL